MATINNTSVNHVGSERVINSLEGLNEATREIMGGIIITQAPKIEAYSFLNTMISSGEMKGQVDVSMGPRDIAAGNPAGTFRVGLTPKTAVTGKKVINNLGEVKFSELKLDSISLEIDQAFETRKERLTSFDGSG